MESLPLDTKLKKTLFNDKHDITIFAYDVELYVQDESETHFSSGVFSVLKNEWITKPKKENPKIDTELIKNKSEQWMKIIDGVIESAKDEDKHELTKEVLKINPDYVSKFINIKSKLSAEEYSQIQDSHIYSLAGSYVSFLIDKYGKNLFLNFFRFWSSKI